MEFDEKKISVLDLAEDMGLEIVDTRKKLNNFFVTTSETNWLGINLLDSFSYYDPRKILLVGVSEINFLKNAIISTQKELLKYIYESCPPLIVFTSDVKIDDSLLKIFEPCGSPLFRTLVGTDEFISKLFSYVNFNLAKESTIHGVLMEIYGMGVLITGGSGIGKSECAIELIRRGHKFVSDDAVQVKVLNNDSLIGISPKNISNFIEVRGVGIINVKAMFGMAAIKETQKVHMEICLQKLELFSNKDRLLLKKEYSEFFGVKVPKVTIPVYSGRSIPVIIETAVMNTKNRLAGYDATIGLLNNLKNF